MRVIFRPGTTLPYDIEVQKMDGSRYLSMQTRDYSLLPAMLEAKGVVVQETRSVGFDARTAFELWVNCGARMTAVGQSVAELVSHVDDGR